MAQLGLRGESLRGSHRSRAVNGHDECRKQCGCFEQRSNDKSEEGQECAVVHRPDHAREELWIVSQMHRTAGAWKRDDFSFRRIFRRTVRDVL